MSIYVKKGNYGHLRWMPCESVPQPWRTVWSFLKKTKNRVTIWSSKPTPGHISWQNRNSKQYKHLMFIAAKTWKQPICPSTDEWIKKMWYLHTVVYSFQFSHSVVSDSLQPHESQHARPPFPSQTPGVYSNSWTLSQWCHPAISSSVVPFSSYPQSLPASGSFPMSQLFPWGGQSIGVSASASVLPMNTQDLCPSGWTGCYSAIKKKKRMK